MEIKLEKFEVKSGKNKGKSFDMISFMNGAKYPTKISLAKVKLVLAHKDAIDLVIKRGSL